MKEERGQWASHIGFILAAAGSAVGLGNMWKFPGKVGAYGGSGFILAYLIGVVFIGFTVMMAELVVGRATGKNAIGAFKSLSKRWTFIGVMGAVTAFIILSYYAVVGGWVLKYIWAYLQGGTFGGDTTAYFTGFVSQAWEPLIWCAAFMLITVLIVVRGAEKGIERVSKVIMPVLFLMLIAIVIRSVTLPGAGEGLSYMLSFNAENFSVTTIVAAIGQAFFSLSLGAAVIITYGSYVPKSENLSKSTALICGLDTCVALLAGFAIIPAVFATNTDLGMGGGFAFMALPNVFAQMPMGWFFGLLFFVLLLFAAITSAISIMEALVAFVTEECGTRRVPTTLILAGIMFLFSVGYSLSQGAVDLRLPWFDFKSGLQMLPMGTVMEYLTDNLFMPLGSLFLCIFVGWIWGAQKGIAEVEQNGKFHFGLKKVWSVSVKYICPVALIVILFYSLVLGIGLS